MYMYDENGDLVNKVCFLIFDQSSMIISGCRRTQNTMIALYSLFKFSDINQDIFINSINNTLYIVNIGQLPSECDVYYIIKELQKNGVEINYDVKNSLLIYGKINKIKIIITTNKSVRLQIDNEYTS